MFINTNSKNDVKDIGSFTANTLVLWLKNSSCHLISDVMAQAVGPLGSRKAIKVGRALMNGIYVFIKEIPESSPVPFAMQESSSG